MFELTIPKAELKDLVIKMSLPFGNNEYVFRTIAPTITPDGYLEWIAKSREVIVWVRAEGIDVSGILEPTRIVLDVPNILKKLTLFKENDVITYSYDVTLKEASLKNIREYGKTAKFRLASFSDVLGMQENFEKKLDSDSVIIFQEDKRPNFQVACDVCLFSRIIEDAHGVITKTNLIYHIIFDEENNLIATTAGDKSINNKTFLRRFHYTEFVRGNGKVLYPGGLFKITKALHGDIKMYASEGEPLGITQDKSKISARYLCQ